jgi:hypothetical protein
MTLEEKYVEFANARGGVQYSVLCTSHEAFIAGAAAMAEILATDQKPLVDELARWRETVFTVLPVFLRQLQGGKA